MKMTLAEVRKALDVWNGVQMVHEDEIAVALQSVSELVVFKGMRDTHNILVAWKDEEGTIRRHKLFGGQYVDPPSVAVTIEDDSLVVVDFKVSVGVTKFESRQMRFRIPSK